MSRLLTGMTNTRKLLQGFCLPFGEDADAVLGEAIKQLTPEEIEIEGGGSSWWYVCPECHGQVDRQDRFCRHCGQALKNDERREKE